jgi:exopolysaccharide biosynthesis predicted pyruvyltransferase EpsI
MPEKNEELLSTEEYAPRRYSKRRSAMMTLKIMLLGGGALGALWLLDTLVAP